MSKKRRYQSGGYAARLSLNLLVQYAIALVAIPGTVVLLELAAEALLNALDFWRSSDLLSSILYWCRDYVELVFLLTTLLGWLIATLCFFRRPLGYLDELVDAAEQLTRPGDGDPIVLSPALRDAQDHLNAAREKAAQDARAAKEAEQRKNDLVVYLAHDLKTPLTSVIGYLTLLRDEPNLPPEFRAGYAGIALDKAERLEDLINEFFEITRFNLSDLELETQTVDLTRMLQQVISEFGPMLAERKLTCTLTAPEKLPCDCDPDKLARVFDNLLRNACGYAEAGSEILVLAVREEDEAVLSFTNSGRTIPPGKLNRIFDRFFRLDSARTSKTGGAGLGLAIAKEIVEAHGGTIGAASADNTVKFTVRLPS